MAFLCHAKLVSPPKAVLCGAREAPSGLCGLLGVLSRLGHDAVEVRLRGRLSEGRLDVLLPSRLKLAVLVNVALERGAVGRGLEELLARVDLPREGGVALIARGRFGVDRTDDVSTECVGGACDEVLVLLADSTIREPGGHVLRDLACHHLRGRVCLVKLPHLALCGLRLAPHVPEALNVLLDSPVELADRIRRLVEARACVVPILLELFSLEVSLGDLAPQVLEFLLELPDFGDGLGVVQVDLDFSMPDVVYQIDSYIAITPSTLPVEGVSAILRVCSRTIPTVSDTRHPSRRYSARSRRRVS